MDGLTNGTVMNGRMYQMNGPTNGRMDQMNGPTNGPMNQMNGPMNGPTLRDGDGQVPEGSPAEMGDGGQGIRRDANDG